MPRTVRPELRCAGVDGCRGGWVVASRQGVYREESIASVLADFDVIGIDMPIGLPTSRARESDLHARRYLSPRGSTVFPTPPRVCLTATDYATACELARVETGKAISIQAWNIVAKIKELDAHISPQHEQRVAEIHPECSFTAMNDGLPLSSKHTELGRSQRASLLRRYFDVTRDPPRGTRIDDVFDAYAVLWSAERFAAGVHITLPPGEPERDAIGLIMRIVV